MIRSRWTLRRILALPILAAFLLAGVVEPAVGMLRDGRVHHETMASASTHPSAGEHGHEDGGGPTHPHAPGHQHGTNGDHCTHAHGLGLTSEPAFGFAGIVVAVREPLMSMAPPAPRRTQSPPPRA